MSTPSDSSLRWRILVFNSTGSFLLGRRGTEADARSLALRQAGLYIGQGQRLNRETQDSIYLSEARIKWTDKPRNKRNPTHH